MRLTKQSFPFDISVYGVTDHVVTDLMVDAAQPEAIVTGDSKLLRNFRNEKYLVSPSEQNFDAMQRLSNRRCVGHPSVGDAVVVVVSDAEDPYRR